MSAAVVALGRGRLLRMASGGGGSSCGIEENNAGKRAGFDRAVIFVGASTSGTKGAAFAAAFGCTGGGSNLRGSGLDATEGMAYSSRSTGAVKSLPPVTLGCAGGSGASFDRSSSTSRLGFESCEVVTDATWSRSITTRVTSGWVSATRICWTSASPTAMVWMPLLRYLRARSVDVEEHALRVGEMAVLKGEVRRNFDGDAGHIA